MDYRATIRDLGTHDVTATFGVAPPQEIVGPLKPQTVHYGVMYPSDPDRGNVLTSRRVPTLHFGFNKYRPDLPPWGRLQEIVLGSTRDDGSTVVANFIDPHLHGIRTTGDLKTVTVAAEGPGEGVDGLEIIDRSGIEEQRKRRGI